MNHCKREMKTLYEREREREWSCVRGMERVKEREMIIFVPSESTWTSVVLVRHKKAGNIFREKARISFFVGSSKRHRQHTISSWDEKSWTNRRNLNEKFWNFLSNCGPRKFRVFLTWLAGDVVAVWPDWAIFKGLGDKFAHKNSPNIWQLIGLFWKSSPLKKNWFGYFLWTIRQTFSFTVRSLFHESLQIWKSLICNYGQILTKIKNNNQINFEIGPVWALYWTTFKAFGNN